MRLRTEPPYPCGPRGNTEMFGVLTTLLCAQALLALSQSQHFRGVSSALARDTDRFRSVSRVFRAGGFTLLLVSLALTVAHWGPGLGLTYWFGIFALTGLIVVLCLEHLTRRPR